MSNSTTTQIINPTCHACGGTGTDEVFGTACTECERWGAQRLPSRDELSAPVDRQPTGQGDGTGASSGDRNAATPKQLAFVESLLSKVEPSNDEQESQVFVIRTILERGVLTKRNASDVIDTLKAMPTKAGADVRANRYAGKCGTCGERVAEQAGRIEKIDGRWTTFHLDGECPAKVEPTPVAEGLDLSSLEQFTSRGIIRMGVPGGDTRLKLRIKFARNGTIYVDDAAVYGEGRSYGRQRPGQAYVGDVADELAAIVADPVAAVQRYAELTSTCGVCAAPLEDADSVARGVGPVCAQKFGGLFG